MKALYTSILIVALAPLSLTAMAQKDTILTRQVFLEREYTPTLHDASKINVQPAIYTPVFQAREVRFISVAPQIGLRNNQLGASNSGDIKTAIDFDKKRGYLVFGAGSFANLAGALGYKLVDEEKDELNLFANHSSMNSGTLPYLQVGLPTTDPMPRYSDSKINLNYRHAFEPSILTLDASFFNTAYNYYGNYFNSSISGAPFDLTSKQNVNVFGIGAGLKNSEINHGTLKYRANLNYNNFSNRYGVAVFDKGVNGGQLDLNVDFFTTLAADKYIGVKGYFMNQSFGNDKSSLLIPNGYHSFTNITGTPYINFEGATWNVNLGVNVSALFDVKNNFVVTPNATASIHFDEKSTLYAEVVGGINDNTFLQILQQNRYVNPIARVEYSKTIYDARLGFRSGIIDGFEFDLYGGYKHTRKDHLFAVTSAYSWGNVSTPLYADISQGHVGGLLKTNLIPCTDLWARITGYFFNVKYTDAYVPIINTGLLTETFAWGRPNFTTEINADVKPLEKVTLSLNYMFLGGRKALYVNEAGVGYPLRMKNLNELNFRTEYRINHWAAINIRLNNLLFQEYELIYGYPLQGFNVLGGVSLKF